MKFIATSDWHLREDKPICRLDDDWIQTQTNILNFIVTTANVMNANILLAGDVFDTPKVSPQVVNMFLNALSKLENTCYVIAGNHSLLWHKQEYLMKSSIGILQAHEYKNIKYLPCQEIENAETFTHYAEVTPEIVMVHALTFPSLEEKPFGSVGYTADQIQEIFSNYKYIIVGDYHRGYIKNGTSKLINCGCITIQDAGDIDYNPVIYYVNTDTDEIKTIYLPSNIELLTREHITNQKERDERINAFIEIVKNNGTITLSFDKNLENALQSKDIPQIVKDIVEEVKQEASTLE